MAFTPTNTPAQLYDAANPRPDLIRDHLEEIGTELDGKSDQAAQQAALDIKADQTDLDATNSTVAGKADQSDLDATNATVATKANQTDLDATNATVATKADQTEVDALDSRILPVGTYAVSDSVEYLEARVYSGGELAYGLRYDGKFVAGAGLALSEDGPEIDEQEDVKYTWAATYSDGGVWLGLKSDGTVEMPGYILPANPIASTWVADYSELALIYASGQSLQAGAKSELPAEVFDALQEPVAAGRAFTFGSQGPRITGGAAGDLTVVAAEADYLAVSDHVEADTGINGATSSWTFIKKLIADSQLTESAFLTLNTAIGGQTLETVTGGAPLRNRRRGMLMASRLARARAVPFADSPIFLLDHQNADRTKSLSEYNALVLAAIAAMQADVSREGGLGDNLITVLTAGSGCYDTNTNSSDVPLSALDLALANDRIVAWGPEYIAQMAVGALAVVSDDPVHRAAIGQALVGLYQGVAVSSVLGGSKRQPLYCAGDFVLAGDGLSATATYTNPRAGSLVVDTTLVTDPATDTTFDAADTRRPKGFMLAAADGKSPHSSGILVTDVTVSTNDVTVTFDADASALAGAAMINVANFYEGQPGGGPSPGGIASGPDRGARACIRNDGSSDAMTLTDPNTLTETTLTPHDWVMPQRIALVAA